MLEDKLLIWKLRCGNRDALSLLYEKYKDDLRTIACSLMHDTHAAEDVLHDVFVTFAENARQLKIRTSLKNYLITCVVNRVRDELCRRQKRIIELNKTVTISSASNCPVNLIVADEESKILTNALAAIPLKQREVIVLHIKGEFKFREIARMQQTSISTVHGRYKYGLKKISAILDGELEK